MSTKTTSEQSHRTITAEVTQIIPPEKHDRYGLSPTLREYAEGQYLCTIREETEMGWLEQRWFELKDWVRDPTTTTDYVHHILLPEVPVEEGTEVTVEVGPTPVKDVVEGEIVSIEE